MRSLRPGIICMGLFILNAALPSSMELGYIDSENPYASRACMQKTRYHRWILSVRGRCQIPNAFGGVFWGSEAVRDHASSARGCRIGQLVKSPIKSLGRQRSNPTLEDRHISLGFGREVARCLADEGGLARTISGLRVTQAISQTRKACTQRQTEAAVVFLNEARTIYKYRTIHRPRTRHRAAVGQRQSALQPHT